MRSTFVEALKVPADLDLFAVLFWQEGFTVLHRLSQQFNFVHADAPS